MEWGFKPHFKSNQIMALDTPKGHLPMTASFFLQGAAQYMICSSCRLLSWEQFALTLQIELQLTIKFATFDEACLPIGSFFFFWCNFCFIASSLFFSYYLLDLLAFCVIVVACHWQIQFCFVLFYQFLILTSYDYRQYISFLFGSHPSFYVDKLNKGYRRII